jgi:hypothetical protein
MTIRGNTFAAYRIPILPDDFIKPHFMPENFHVWIEAVIFPSLDLPDEPLYFGIFKPGIDEHRRNVGVHGINDVL